MVQHFTRKDHLSRLVADLPCSMLTAIGLQLSQYLDTSEELPPALAALLAHIDRNTTEPDGNKLEEPQG